MTECVARLVAVAGFGEVDGPPVYLRAYDPEADGGIGKVETTTDKSEAKVFANAGELLECRNWVPQCRPVRRDGKPNRPLSAFTIEIEIAGK